MATGIANRGLSAMFLGRNEARAKGEDVLGFVQLYWRVDALAEMHSKYAFGVTTLCTQRTVDI